jgi:hypothetical protein
VLTAPAHARSRDRLNVVGPVALWIVPALNAAAFGAARWHLGEEAARRGIPVDSIDAGYEWLASHVPTTAASGTQIPGEAGALYSPAWPTFRPCAMVSSSQIDRPDASLEMTDTYRLMLLAGAETPMHLYGVSNPGCP